MCPVLCRIPPRRNAPCTQCETPSCQALANHDNRRLGPANQKKTPSLLASWRSQTLAQEGYVMSPSQLSDTVVCWPSKLMSIVLLFPAAGLKRANNNSSQAQLSSFVQSARVLPNSQRVFTANN